MLIRRIASKLISCLTLPATDAFAGKARSYKDVASCGPPNRSSRLPAFTALPDGLINRLHGLDEGVLLGPELGIVAAFLDQ